MPDTPTFLWHDYETFGVDPRRCRPAQFAAQRTNAALEPLGEPLNWYCQPALDVWPEPQACLITGITPQIAAQRGLSEHEFATHIALELGRPGTLGVGYNSIRYDDEVTRHLLWRNLRDPYAREWRDGCGRWDLLDVARTAHALRPQGLSWPQGEAGAASFKLTDLSAANGLLHAAAHDAASDVGATIALARAIRRAQPKLWDYCLSLHRKERVAQTLGLPCPPSQARVFWHVSGMFGAQRGCLALMIALGMHPSNRNEVLAWDLAHDPAELADLRPEQVRQRLFTPSPELPSGVSRLPIKSVHLNRSPMLGGDLRVLTPEVQSRWGLDLAAAQRHAERARALPDLSHLWAQVYARPADAQPPDVDEDLYGGFVGAADRRRLDALLLTPPAELALQTPGFDDPRLAELVWRWRARNFVSSLSPAEQQRWRAHCQASLIDGAGGGLSLQAYSACIDALYEPADTRGQGILEALSDWTEVLLDPA